MSVERTPQITPKMQSALAELEATIRECYPDAQFRVSSSQDDSEIIHLMATVDVEDTEDVLNLVIDRMMELQIEEGLPLFVIPVRPRERVLAQLNEQRGQSLPWVSRREDQTPRLSVPAGPRRY